MATCRAAYAPLSPPVNALYREFLVRVRRENSARPCPNPICNRCGFPMDEEDVDTLFRDLCDICGGRKLDKLLRRARRRLGRKGVIRSLKNLARGG